MSGAKKKLAQKEAMAQMGLTEKEKKALAEASRKKRNTILGIIGGAIVVVLVIALLVWNSGIIPRSTTALEVNGHKYTVADMEYYYHQLGIVAYNQEMSMVQMYESAKEQGYDWGEYTPKFDLYGDWKTQYVDEEKTQSYHDYFLEQAKSEVTRITALVDAANAENYTLSEEAQKELDNSLTSLDEQVRSNGFSGRSAYFRLAYGRNVNEKVYMKNVRLSTLANDYYSSSIEKLTDYTDEDLNAYRLENEALYNSYDYDYAYFDGTPVKETAEDGTTVEPTEEQKTQAMADAKDKAEKLLADVKAAQTATLAEGETRKTFAEVAAAYTADPTSRVRYLAANFKDSAYGEWLMDSERKDGDVEMFESTGNGYYVVQYHNSYFYNEPTVDARHILIRAETSEDAELNENNVPIPTQEQMDAAKAEAEDLMKQFNLGEKTADAFGELAEEHSDDGRNSEGALNAAGGLYTDIHKGDMVKNFENWCFDSSRKEGDVGLVENAGPGYYGWHVVYYQAYHEPAWKDGTNGARSAKTSADQTAWAEKVEEGYEAVATSAYSQVGQ